MQKVKSDVQYVRRIALTNFRNYDSLDLSIKGDLVFFTGNNGVGKTSLLEAVCISGLVKSFRRGNDKVLIKNGSEFYNVSLDIEKENIKTQLHVAYGKHPDAHASSAMKRTCAVDGDKKSRLSDFIGNLQVVVFSPNDIDIVDTTVAERRRFVDIILSSLYKSYLSDLQDYRKILKMRSELLRKFRHNKSNDRSFFKSLDIEYAKVGARLQQRRMEFLDVFQVPFSKYISMISDNQDNWQIKYRPSIPGGQNEAVFLQTLDNGILEDIRLSQNTKGIHRDKIEFVAGKYDIQNIGSQGQKRTLALALKMAQYEYAKEKTHQAPVLLIDDVLNELDINRRTRFISFLNDIGQALITTTDLKGIESFLYHMKSKFEIQVFEISHSNDDTIVLNEIDI